MTRKFQEETLNQSELAAILHARSDWTGADFGPPAPVTSEELPLRECGKKDFYQLTGQIMPPPLAEPPRRKGGKLESNDLDTKDLLLRMESRLVRLETRVTNTMRFLGFPPHAPMGDGAAGQVVISHNQITVTGPDVPLRDIQYAVSRMHPQPKLDIPIVFNNVLWATLHVNPAPVVGHSKGDTDEQR